MTPECKICEDRGIIFDGKEAKPCDCVRERNLRRRVEKANLPPRLRGHTFDRFSLRYYSKIIRDDRGRSAFDHAADAVRHAKEFVEAYLVGESREGLMFCGDVGAGKTFLASCIANAVLERGGEVLFLVVPDFLDQIRATYDGRDEITERDLIECAKNVPLLILDDLGAHMYTEWARQKIYSLLNHRLNYELPVIVTTNLDLEGFAQHLGWRTASRLFEMCRIYRLMREMDIRIRKKRDALGD